MNTKTYLEYVTKDILNCKDVKALLGIGINQASELVKLIRRNHSKFYLNASLLYGAHRISAIHLFEYEGWTREEYIDFKTKMLSNNIKVA